MTAEPTESVPRVEVRVRTAKRHDVPALVDLRVRYLAETARLEPRFAVLPDVREKVAHELPVWLGQEERVFLVLEEARGEGVEGPLLGYATGVVSVWPPIWKRQHVGEVHEGYVDPAVRGRGLGRRIIGALTDALVLRGAHVLRAPAPVKNADLVQRLEALGYRPLQYVMERNLEDL